MTLTKANRRTWQDHRHVILPPFLTVGDLVEVCHELDVDPSKVQTFGKYHGPTDNQSGICLVAIPPEDELTNA